MVDFFFQYIKNAVRSVEHNMMVRLIIILFCIINVAYAPLIQPKWSDEFNGTKLDITKWKLGWPNRWKTVNTLDNIEVKNGSLFIKAKTKDGIHSTSMITTEGIFERSYGYWEVSVRFTDLPGTWSDFWLYTRKMYPEKLGAEIDIFEHRLLNYDSSLIPDIVSYGVHYNGYGEDGFCKGGKIQLNRIEGWHIFGLRATKDGYIWFLDGVKVAAVSPTTAEPLFMILSTEIMDWNWAGRTLKSYDNVMMEVDYIRFYE